MDDIVASRGLSYSSFFLKKINSISYELMIESKDQTTVVTLMLNEHDVRELGVMFKAALEDYGNNSG